jgi:methionine-rich copper-binding protein CopC
MTSVRLKASDSSLVTTGTATQNKAAGSPVVFTVKAAMKPGTYVLSWKTMGSDGHAVDGNFKFSVKAAASQ